MSDDDKRSRLLAYFSHRYASLVGFLKEAIRTKRLQAKSPNGVQQAKPSAQPEEAKIFILNNKGYAAGDCNEEEAEAEQERQLKEYR